MPWAMTPDMNLLVAASRTDRPHHVVARARFEEAVNASGAGAAFALMPMVLASFLRLLTSPKIFRMPTPIEDAVAFVDALLASPGVQLASLCPEWSKLRQLCLDKQLGGNDIPDAWLAGRTKARTSWCGDGTRADLRGHLQWSPGPGAS
jgi:predicted nucleic acid-binding protein